MSSWDFLYKKNYMDDLVLYTNRKYLRYISCHSIFKGNVSDFFLGTCPKNNITRNIENLTEWQSNPDHNSRFGGIEKWIEYKNHVQTSKSIEEIHIASTLIKQQNTQTIKNNTIYDSEEFYKNILPLIKNNPKTKFILFFPPYSIVKFAIDIQTNPDEFIKYKDLVKKIVLESEIYSNTEIYWFADKDFIKDISNYKDLTHYSGKYNSFFLNEFSTNNSIINNINYNELLNKLENNAMSFDLVRLDENLN